jgi:hypothetical protein
MSNEQLSREEIENLRKLANKSGSVNDGWIRQAGRIVATIDDKDRQIARLREYAAHPETCAVTVEVRTYGYATGRTRCTCGLDQLLAELEDTNE